MLAQYALNEGPVQQCGWLPFEQFERPSPEEARRLSADLNGEAPHIELCYCMRWPCQHFPDYLPAARYEGEEANLTPSMVDPQYTDPSGEGRYVNNMQNPLIELTDA